MIWNDRNGNVPLPDGFSTQPSIAYEVVSAAPVANVTQLTGLFVAGGWTDSINNMTAVLAAGSALTLPTVAQLVAAYQSLGQSPLQGSSFTYTVINTSTGAFSYTLTAPAGGGGWTLLGTQTIPQNVMRSWIITFTSLTTATVQSIGASALSGAL